MNFKFQVSNFKSFGVNFHKTFSIFFLVNIFAAACSVPNLEKPECDESRETVKQFYSFHFGNDLKPNPEKLENSKVFLTERLFEELKNKNETLNDYFTQTEDYPRAFRVGGCEAVSETKTVFEVLLFWKDETRNEQKEIKVEVIKENEKWLIDKVSQ